MNRLDSISDSTGTLVACTYLGAGQIVKETDAGATLSYLNTDGTNVTGLDRFGRIADQLWESYGDDPTVIDEYAYQYDQAGNVRSKTNNTQTNGSLDELYDYNNLDALTSVKDSRTTKGTGAYTE